jgi:hypothetical protein
MKANEAIERAVKVLTELSKLKPSGVTGVFKDERGWHVTIEMVEKKSIPDAMDLLGNYEVILNEDGELISYERKGLRKRSDTGEEG